MQPIYRLPYRKPADVSTNFSQTKGQEQTGAASDGDGGPQPDLEQEQAALEARYSTEPEQFPSPIREEALHGIFGKIVHLMTQHCEASQEALLLQGLVIIGNIIGRSAYIYAGGPRLFPNEFTVQVGDTARGRKGTAYRMWEQLISLVAPDWQSNCIATQTQTGEGLIHRIRDERHGIRPGKKNSLATEELLEAGVSDKRLLLLEEEFSHVLKNAQRRGNTLTEIIRRGWDSPLTLDNGNKNSPLKASLPHVSLIGHTTRHELLETLKAVDLKNGLANRILWCAARRTGDLPDAEEINWQQHTDILDWLSQIFEQRQPDTTTPLKFTKTDQAKIDWDTLYKKLNAEKRDGFMDDLLARDTVHILKIALILAVTDQCDTIRPQHLKAALAVVDFCQHSARWIFGQATGNKLANNILWELRRTPAGLTRKQLCEDICYRATPKTQIERALSILVQNNLACPKLELGVNNHRVERWFPKA